MKIFYVILSCKQNRNTRQFWQFDTWLRKKEIDFVYLDNPVSEETYENIPKKYANFFKNYNFHYDWIFFCEDDTFVYTDKLEAILSYYNRLHKLPVMIGHKWGEFKYGNLNIECCFVGAGFAMSGMLVKEIKKYLNYSTYTELYGPTTGLAIWAKLASDFVLINRFDLFNPNSPGKGEMPNYITYHNCTKDDFYSL